jgi:hypothetical protein
MFDLSNLIPSSKKHRQIVPHPLLQRLPLHNPLLFLAHAGFFTTLPSSQRTSGDFKARCSALTFFAARLKARSARATNAGVLRFVVCPFRFMRQSTVSRILHHLPQNWRVVLPAACGCPRPPSAPLIEGNHQANESGFV